MLTLTDTLQLSDTNNLLTLPLLSVFDLPIAPFINAFFISSTDTPSRLYFLFNAERPIVLPTKCAENALNFVAFNFRTIFCHAHLVPFFQNRCKTIPYQILCT